MAKKNFSWDNFKFDFIENIVYSPHTTLEGIKPKESSSKMRTMACMNAICPYPDSDFVRKYRREIEKYFFNDSTYLIDMMLRLEKLKYGGCEVGTNKKMMEVITEKPMTQTLLDYYLRELRMAGINGYVDDGRNFFNIKIVDLNATKGDDIPLYSYQEEAVAKMKEYFMDDDNQSGILVMPTGSGKTRTSVYFLLKEMASRGYQILWFAHRSMLLEQAAVQFYKSTTVLANEKPSMDKFKMVCISGKHGHEEVLKNDDNLIISSVLSMCNKTEVLKDALQDKVIMVIDEAHHSIAPSYRKIINAVREFRPNAKLLGLTATPVRMNERDMRALMHMFEDKPIFSVSMGQLIAEKKLSTPIPVRKETNVDIKPLINIDEEKYIKKMGRIITKSS